MILAVLLVFVVPGPLCYFAAGCLLTVTGSLGQLLAPRACPLLLLLLDNGFAYHLLIFCIVVCFFCCILLSIVRSVFSVGTFCIVCLM